METFIWVSVILTIAAWICTYLLVRYTNELKTNGMVAGLALLSIIPVVNLAVVFVAGFGVISEFCEKYVAEWWNQEIKR